MLMQALTVVAQDLWWQCSVVGEVLLVWEKGVQSSGAEGVLYRMMPFVRREGKHILCEKGQRLRGGLKGSWSWIAKTQVFCRGMGSEEKLWMSSNQGSRWSLLASVMGRLRVEKG